MSFKLSAHLLLLAALAAGTVDLAAQPALAGIDAAALYQQHCAACHGPQRLGGMGPALLPESLARLRKTEALKVIHEGRAATQMAGFDTLLKAPEIAALAEWIYTPVTPAPATRTGAPGTKGSSPLIRHRSWPATHRRTGPRPDRR